MKVQCPMCKQLTHSLTPAFDPDVRPNRSMLKLLPKWEQWHPGDGWMTSDLECPNCCAPLAPSGRLRLVSDDHQMIRVVTLAETNQDKINKMFPEEVDHGRPNHFGRLPKREPEEEPLSKADQIRDLLHNSDMTHKAIADYVGCSQQYVSRIKKDL